MARVHLLDKGTEFIGDLGTDVSAAIDPDTKWMIFKKPDGTLVTKDAVFVTDGTDFLIKYVAEAGFLDVLDGWQSQAHVILPNGEWKSDWDSFNVWPNLEADE